jgi:hypothetical protein
MRCRGMKWTFDMYVAWVDGMERKMMRLVRVVDKRRDEKSKTVSSGYPRSH